VHAPSEEKSDDSKDRFYEELEKFSEHFRKYRMKMFWENFTQNWGQSLFSNRQVGMTVYKRLVVIMVLV
jgi:hypothetical protein